MKGWDLLEFWSTGNSAVWTKASGYIFKCRSNWRAGNRNSDALASVLVERHHKAAHPTKPSRISGELPGGVMEVRSGCRISEKSWVWRETWCLRPEADCSPGTRRRRASWGAQTKADWEGHGGRLSARKWVTYDVLRGAFTGSKSNCYSVLFNDIKYILLRINSMFSAYE